MTLRKLTNNERELVKLILDAKGEPIEFVDEVKTIDTEGSLKFSHHGVFADKEHKKFPVEAQSRDTDGVWIHALLFLIDDEVDELEFYKDDSSSIRSMPTPKDWEIIDLSET